MGAYIQNIATIVPENIYEQNFLRDKMKKYLSNDRATRSIIHRIYTQSGIEKRHTVVKDFNNNGDPRFFFQKDGSLNTPSTGTRNNLYVKHAKKLFVDVAHSLIDENPTIDAQDITHVITVSCTGFFAPGPDYEIVKQLSLSPSTQRFHLGFMGCFAAFPALKMAKSFCEARDDAVVMVVCLELCSIHFQQSQETDNLISASVFADGGAGAIVSSKSPEEHLIYYQLEDFATTIVQQSEKDMAWTIGDTGFEMVLSMYVPEIIESNLQPSLQPLLEKYGIEPLQIDHWAIHPGGRAILDKVQNNLGLHPNQLLSSRIILSEYGNMSSATILFVLNHLMQQPMKADTEWVLGMAFGPGLTVESGLFLKQKG